MIKPFSDATSHGKLKRISTSLKTPQEFDTSTVHFIKNVEAFRKNISARAFIMSSIYLMVMVGPARNNYCYCEQKSKATKKAEVSKKNS